MAGCRFVLLTLSVAFLTGCRTYVQQDMTLQSPHYLRHPPQYYPPGELAQAQATPPASTPPVTQRPQREIKQHANATCKVYPLSDFAADPKLCQWIAATIPQMIEPASWNGTELRYYAPAKVVVINHTPAVHAKVDAFLQDLRKTRPKPSVVPARFDAPVATQPTSPATPKHLFHFSIRYEGDGGVTANLPNLMPINSYSSDPMIRMEQLMIDSENLRQMHDEWRMFWMKDQPSQLTPYRIHGGVGPASSSISTPPLSSK